MNVLFLYADTPNEWNTSQWRCILPAQAISSVPGWTAVSASLMEMLQGNQDQDPIAWADIIVIERLLVMEVLPKIEQWKALGKLVLGSLDDDYAHMPSTVASYDFWHKGLIHKEGRDFKIEYRPIDQLVWGAKLVDGLLLASHQLVEDWKKYTPYVYWFPNYMDTWSYIQARGNRVASANIRLGWGGSFTHVESWRNSGILPALQEVCKARPQVKLLIAGGDTRILDLVRVAPDQKRLLPWVGYDQWPNLLANFDIGLIPLSGSYDSRRSWIKAIEYMVMGIPWVGSDSATMTDVADMGILVPNSPNSWRRALLHMIDNLADYRERAARFANEYPRIDIRDQGRALVRVLQAAQENCERKLL